MTVAAEGLDLAQWADPLWRLRNLYSIVTDEGKEMRFTPNDEQIEFYSSVWYRNLILKARQLGFTTFIDIVALDQCLFVPNFTAMIIAHSLPDAKKIFRMKVKRVYDALPLAIREKCPLLRESSDELVFANGSSISVSTSSRGGTVQFLHVSEMGKIARKFPHRAEEIVSGAFESVPLDGTIIVESTAEGQEGWFYDACMLGLRRQQQTARDTKLDFRLHFFPWWKKASYTLGDEDAAGTVASDKQLTYFAGLQAKHGIELTSGQIAWYIKKQATLTDNMGREYPSTVEESFAAALEGTIYAMQMAAVRKLQRIGPVPIRQSAPVNTFWDLGIDDATSIWLHQRAGSTNRFLRYFESSGEGLGYYWRILEEWREEHELRWGKHYLPHDGSTRIPGGYDLTTRKKILEDLGMRDIVIVPRIHDLMDGVEAVRQILPECEFDEVGCVDGINALDFYSREWNEEAGVWSRRPKHNKWSHGADSFRQFAQAFRVAREEPGMEPAGQRGGYGQGSY